MFSKKHEVGPCAQFVKGMITFSGHDSSPPGLESSLGHFLLCVLGQAVNLSVRNFSCLSNGENEETSLYFLGCDQDYDELTHEKGFRAVTGVQ